MDQFAKFSGKPRVNFLEKNIPKAKSEVSLIEILAKMLT